MKSKSWNLFMAFLLCAGASAEAAANATVSDPFTFSRGRLEQTANAATLVLRFRVEETDPAVACAGWRAMALVRASPDDAAWQLVGSTESGPEAEFVLRGIPGTPTLVVVICPGRPGYSLHGPHVWSARDATPEVLTFRRRRTVRVPTGSAFTSGVRMVLPQYDDAAPWPRCHVLLPDRAECVGVPYEATGVVLATVANGLRWALAKPQSTTVQTAVSVGASWGRLIQFVDAGSRLAVDLRVTTWLEKRTAPGITGSRVRFVPDSSTQVHQLDSRSTWIVGRDTADGRFLEVKGEGVATVRVSTERLRDTAAEHPFTIFLRSAVSVTGAVVDAAGRPAGGSLVSVFELVPVGDTNVQRLRDDAFEKRWIAETYCDHDGNFYLRGPPRGRYEFLVTHPTQGRVTEERALDGTPITFQLRSTPRVKGRVSQNHKPLVGVHVRSVPDLHVFLESVDPIQVLTPGVVTDPYGEFELSLPERGGGEVVVGGGELATSRHRYVDAESLPPVTDLGEIVLPRPLELTVRLPRQGCELHAAGPVGGLSLSQARSVYDPRAQVYRFRLSESGFWWLEAECDGEMRALLPPVVRVNDTSGGQTLDARLAPVED